VAGGTVKSLFAQALLSDALRDIVRAWHRLKRGGRRTLWYAHQVDDPYSLLTAQAVRRLAQAADVDLRVTVLPAPEEAFNPDRQRLRTWALLDASRLARQYGLRFPERPSLPSQEAVAVAAGIALTDRPPGEQLGMLAEMGEALFSGGPIHGVAADDADALLARNAAELRKARHYQGGMIFYEGEWFWSVDRLPLLEARLREEGLSVPDTLDWSATPLPEPIVDGAELEFFFSFRSPYSYLAVDRTIALAARHGIALRIRPVLPMVMRGLSVPLDKRMYLVRDARRLAQVLEIPFGRIADPLGVGVERCLAVSMIAGERLPQWLSHAGRGIWSQGIDVATDAGLAALAARAGLDPAAAIAAANGPEDAWRAMVAENREALLEMGLWGVPSFRMGDLIAWGQDRLDLLEVSLAARSA